MTPFKGYATPGLSHAPFATHPEVVNPDLLAFVRA
jgi:non-heme chloroperoxidase